MVLEQEERIRELRKKAMALPFLPGVYIMRGILKDIIYIGKAKSLKNRVSQYFGSQNNLSEKVRQMVNNVLDFDYIITDSEYEALVLECSLIKQYTPKYNIRLKDDKGYSYVKISSDTWRRISFCFHKEDESADYLGPFQSYFHTSRAVEEAIKIFQLPVCSKNFPGDFKKDRPCLNYHMKMCCAPCRGKISLEYYNQIVNEAIAFLKGGGDLSIKQLKSDMEKAAESLNFERAAILRDRINTIKRIKEKQKVFSYEVPEQDVVAFISDGKKVCFEVFRFKEGRLYDRDGFFVDDTGDQNQMLFEFLINYYTIRSDIPKVIAADREPEDMENLERYLSDKKGCKVFISVPKRGAQHQLVQMCRNNAADKLAQTKSTAGTALSVLEELKTILCLEHMPEYIESYDISHTAGDENVAGMVVFKDGKPLKSAYRKFKIKSFSGQDDCGSMREILQRRFEEYIKLKDLKDDGFARLPDLILLDGGKGQVQTARQVLKLYSLDLPVFGMVKDDKHKTRALTGAEGEIAIRSKQRLFSFICNIQEEVHRFALGYHSQRRKKSMLSSTLTKIDGIGTERAKSLLKYFGTISNIENAGTEELLAVPKMNKQAARAVFNHFHK